MAAAENKHTSSPIIHFILFICDTLISYRVSFDPFDVAGHFTRFLDALLGINETAQLNRPLYVSTPISNDLKNQDSDPPQNHENQK